MKTLKIHGKTDMREEQVPLPEPAAGQVRLRMAYAGICGSDLHYYFHGANGEFVVKEALSPGHELSGVRRPGPLGRARAGHPGHDPPSHVRPAGARHRGPQAPVARGCLPRQRLDLAAHAGRHEPSTSSSTRACCACCPRAYR